MAKVKNRQKMNIFGKISKTGIFFYILGGTAVALVVLFLTSCFLKGDKTVMTFVINLEYYSKHFAGIFENLTSGYFLMALSVGEFIYICLILIHTMKPNKYMRGKEYGSAEWGDVYAVNAFLSSTEPAEKFKVYYTPEGKGKKFIRKLFENKKKYIK